MRYVKKYDDGLLDKKTYEVKDSEIVKFNEWSSVNEGIGKFFRSFTGENKERIDTISNSLNNIKVKYNGINDDIKPEILNKLKDNIRSRYSSIDVQTLLLNLFTSSDSENAKNLEFIKDLSDKEFSNLKYAIDNSSDGILVKMRGIEVVVNRDKKEYNLNNAKIASKKEYDDIISTSKTIIGDIFKKDDLVYYIKFISNPFSGSGFGGYTGESTHGLSTFVKSLCLKLNLIDEFNEYYYRASSVDYPNGYNKEYGSYYKNKITAKLEDIVTELPAFKKLKTDIDEFLPKIKDIETRVKKWNESQDSSSKIEFYDVFKTDKIHYSKTQPFISLSSIVENFLKIERSLTDKTIEDVFKSDNEFFNVSHIPLVITEDSDRSTCIPDDDGNLISGNIFYFGGIFYDLTMDNLQDFLVRSSKYDTGGPTPTPGAIYCGITQDIAVQYMYHRTHQGWYNNIKRLVDKTYIFPCVYKITVKPGTKFLHKADVGLEKDELEYLKEIKVMGIHSGNNKDVQGGGTQETAITNISCVESIYRMTLEDLEKGIVSGNERSTSLQDEKFYLEWYKNFIKNDGKILEAWGIKSFSNFNLLCDSGEF